MRYLIHACKEREWYVNGYLIPSMLKQGIPKDEIKVWMDSENKGNLFSCMDSFAYCGRDYGATWHLQDDVIISRDFYEKTKKTGKTFVICGFCGNEIGPNPKKTGLVTTYEMWWSFQCIQIPNDLAWECSEWFYKDAMLRTEREDIQKRIASRKSDDWFWKRFLRECKPFTKIINLKPNLVDHIDYLLGGSIVNKDRKKDHTSAYFKDRDLVEKLEEELKNVSRE